VNVRVAGTAFAAALSVLLISAWQALRIEPVRPFQAADGGLGDTTSSASEREGYSLARIMEAVDNDPFHPLRRRPAHRFHSAGSEVKGVLPALADRGLGIQVIGTAVSAGGGGFAMCAWGGAPPRIVRIGERVGDWTLRAVTPGAAQFVSATGASTVVRIAKPGEGS